MNYKTIAVIGLGTLGGFVANALSNNENVESLILIDHDIVETKNLENSIYRQVDFGVYKTEALTEIISNKNKDITIISINEIFIEGKTKIPQCDLVLDCRDYTYDRRKEIDARLYISSRYLIVDCRKNVNYNIKTEGKYLIQLSKEDLRYAGSLVSILIYNNTIETLIRKSSIKKYELDYVKHIDDYSYDIIYENPNSEDKFLNLPDKIIPIIEANQQSNLNVYIGSYIFPLFKESIPQNSLTTGTDVILKLSNIVSKNHQFNHFVLSLHKQDGGFLLELIPETGAA